MKRAVEIQNAEAVLFESGGVTVRAGLVSDHILRLTAGIGSKELIEDDTFVVEKKNLPFLHDTCIEENGRMLLKSTSLTVSVLPEVGTLTITADEQPIHFSTPAGQTFLLENGKISFTANLPEGTAVYGLGQNTFSRLDLRGKERKIWHYWDSFRYGDNVGMPFLMTSDGYGLLLNSSWASRFTIGGDQTAPHGAQIKPEPPWPVDEVPVHAEKEYIRCILEGGSLDIFIICGPTYKEILTRYTMLTGRSPIPPKWALGLIQSKYRYRNQNELLEIGHGFAKRNLPVDVLVIDAFWFDRMGDLSWIKEDWPDPSAMCKELATMGMHVMVAQHPYMDEHSIHYEEFEKNQYLITWNREKTVDGWPPRQVHHAIDFTNPNARELWWKKVKSLTELGICGYWTDMGELETHIEGVSQHYLGEREKIHNIYSLLWSKALYDGHRSDYRERAFILSRVSYPGIQRYATAMWSGDTGYSWEVLDQQVVIGQQVCASGQPWWGTDIGAFLYKGTYEPELYLRWYQWGVFCPLFRTHGARCFSEPWELGELSETLLSRLLKLRYALMPYIYTESVLAAETGIPVMRAMFMEYPEDRFLESYIHQYHFGSNLLVAPVTEKGAREKAVFLPHGTWYGLTTEIKYTGNQRIHAFAPLWEIPVFVKAGTILIKNDTVPVSPYPSKYYIHLYPGSDGTYTLYEDDGTTYEYEQGKKVTTDFIFQDKCRQLTILPAAGVADGFPAWRSYVVVLHDADDSELIMANGCRVPSEDISYNAALRQLTFQLHEISTAKETSIKLPPSQKRQDILQSASSSDWYDLEYRTDINGYLVRIYGNPHATMELTPPIGWKSDFDGTEAFHEDARLAFRFLLRHTSDLSTQSDIVTVTSRLEAEQTIRSFCLSGGWVNDWKLAGVFKEKDKSDALAEQLNDASGKAYAELLCVGTDAFSSCRDLDVFGYVNLYRHYNHYDNVLELFDRGLEYTSAFGYCRFQCPDEREAYLIINGEDRFRVWANGSMAGMLQNCDSKPGELRIKLLSGTNHIVVECVQFYSLEWSDRIWGYRMRIADSERKPMNDLTFTTNAGENQCRSMK